MKQTEHLYFKQNKVINQGLGRFLKNVFKKKEDIFDDYILNFSQKYKFSNYKKDGQLVKNAKIKLVGTSQDDSYILILQFEDQENSKQFKVKVTLINNDGKMTPVDGYQDKEILITKSRKQQYLAQQLNKFLRKLGFQITQEESPFKLNPKKSSEEYQQDKKSKKRSKDEDQDDDEDEEQVKQNPYIKQYRAMKKRGYKFHDYDENEGNMFYPGDNFDYMGGIPFQDLMNYKKMYRQAIYNIIANQELSRQQKRKAVTDINQNKQSMKKTAQIFTKLQSSYPDEFKQLLYVMSHDINDIKFVK